MQIGDLLISDALVTGSTGGAYVRRGSKGRLVGAHRFILRRRNTHMTTLSTPPRTGFELANGRSPRRATGLEAAGGPEAAEKTDPGRRDPSAAGETETRIVVIDDHAVVRDALVTVLSETS